MEVISVLIIIVVLIILINLNSSVKKTFRQNKVDVKTMQRALSDINKKIDGLGINQSKTPIVEAEAEEREDVLTYQHVNAQTEKQTYLESILESDEDEGEEIEELLVQIEEEKKEISTVSIEEEPIKEDVKYQIPEKKKTFFENHPDLEKFIGENLINKIGIVILVLGLGFLVKYAIDKDWIDEVGRVAIGVLSASVLIGLAHKLRKEYKSFSSVLIGGGLALLYFTITLAFHTEGYPLYQEQTLSFAILVFITIFAVFLSITYNRIEIAILAILGGFGSPLMLSNGSGNYIILFSYMTILNIGMLVLSYYKKWRLVNVLAFGLTVLLFSSWLITELLSNKYSAFGGAVFFATGFYVIFFLMNIIYNIKYKVGFKVGDISLILSNTFIYFTFVMLMLPHINDGAYKGLFSVLLGLFNFGFAFYIHKRQETDKNLLYLLIGLVFTFITLAIPLQLNGNYITLFWSIESVLLLWLSQKSGFKIMKIGSLLVLSLMLISITMDWSNNYNIIGYSTEGYVKEFMIFFNKMFVTTLIAVVSLIATSVLLRNESDKTIWGFPISSYRLLITGLTLAVLYTGGLLEVNYQSYHYFIEKSSQQVILLTYNSIFVLSLLIFALKQNKKEISMIIGLLATVFIVVFLGSISTVYAKSVYSIIKGEEFLPTTLLVFRWISIFAVYISSILLFKVIKKIQIYLNEDFVKFNIIFLVFTILYLISADLDTIAVLITKSKDVLIHTQKTGYAIVWGISSFLLMIIGMKLKNKIIRILSLALFAITIAKLFIYDISNISEGGKIVAFILLGVLLLIISFMYQKVKKLVIEDDLASQDDKENINITSE